MNVSLLKAFTDLTPARVELLKRAAEGSLDVMNGATYFSMRELIGPKEQGYPITEYGRVLLERAQQIESGELADPGRVNDRVEYTPALARRIKKIWPEYYSPDIKLMMGLWNFPGQTWMHLADGYGGRTVTGLIDLQAVSATRGISLGSQCYLTELGIEVIHSVRAS